MPTNIDPDVPQPRNRQRRRRISLWALHPLGHIVSLVSLHVVALLVIDKTPLLNLLWLH